MRAARQQEFAITPVHPFRARADGASACAHCGRARYHANHNVALSTRMTCAEADCPNYARGFAIVLDPQDDRHAKAAQHIEWDSGRRYVKQRSEDALDWFVNHGTEQGFVLDRVLMGLLRQTPPGMLVYVFPPGQQCFQLHADREVHFRHDGYLHQRPLDFNEDHNERMYEYRRAQERG